MRITKVTGINMPKKLLLHYRITNSPTSRRREMNNIKTNLLWIILALTNKWYYTLLLFSFINPVTITKSISALWQHACDLPPTHPFAPIASYICAGSTTRHIDESALYSTAVISGYDGLHNLVSGTPGESVAHLPVALASIDDAVFLAKKSQIDCRDELAVQFLLLESGSRSVGDNLEELRAKVLSSVDL